jgi:hypothetical protein
MRQRAYAYLARRVTSAAKAGPFVQELLHLAAASSAGARFYAAAKQRQVHVRAASPGDLARLLELCRTGITRPGYPPDERARQLQSDFPAAQRHFAVTEDADGQIAGFAYTIWLNSASWRTAARTREDFFAGLPELEMAAIRTAPESAPLRACLIASSTHLPGHDHVDAALRAYLFERAYDRHSVATELTGYHLLTADCLDLARLSSAGLTRRRVSIRIGDCLADEWLLRFGDTGFAGWIAEMLGVGPVDAKPPPGALTAGQTLGLLGTGGLGTSSAWVRRCRPGRRRASRAQGAGRAGCRRRWARRCGQARRWPGRNYISHRQGCGCTWPGGGSRAPVNLIVVHAETSLRAMAGGAGMSEITHEEALLLADALLGQALKETDARCSVLAQFIDGCDRAGSRTSAWSEALRELHALHGHRRGLMSRRSLIQQALECPVGESPTKTPLSPPPNRTVLRTQQQVQVQARRRR